MAAGESDTSTAQGIEAIGDLVLSIGVQHAIGASSRAPVEWRLAFLGAVRGSRLSRVQFFADMDEAVRAAQSG